MPWPTPFPCQEACGIVRKMSENERRKLTRIDVYAQATIATGDEVYVMAVRNLSSGGVYLEGTPAEYPELKPGTSLDIVLFASEDGADNDDLTSCCAGEVIRIDPGFPGKRPPGFGVIMRPVDDAARDCLVKLMLRASGYTVKTAPPTS